MFEYKDIRYVHLEISSRCNASCPDCPRNLRGADYEGDYVVHDMTLNEAKKIFSINFLQQLTKVIINGNHGDFITCREGVNILKYFTNANPRLQLEISTNASGQPKIWEELAKFKTLEVQFRLDGLRDTHHLYRQYTDFDLIINNAKTFIAAGGRACWTMIKFNFNEHQIAEAKALSKELGFSRFELVDVGRNNTVVFTRDGKYSHTIGNPVPEIREFPVLLATKEQAVKFHDHSEYYNQMIQREIKCQVQKPAWIYVQSNGEVYPCCWIGRAPMTNVAALGTDQTRSICKNNNALEVGIEKSIEWFDELEKTWTATQQHWTCNDICGVKQ